ncbi:MAG: efflux RND transporter permease subunit [bacterium]
MNVFGSLCKNFVVNEKLSLLLFIGITLWGIISFTLTPKQYNPEITAPAFEITVGFPGHTAQETYELVTKPLEDVVQEIPGVDEIYSQSHHGGQSIVTVLFDVGKDFDLSKIRLRQRLDTNLNLKPLGVENILVEAIDPDNLAIMTLGLFSDTLDPVSLRKQAFEIRNELKKVNGTSVVAVTGGRQREFSITLNPEKLKETKTAITEVAQALNNSSLLRVLGTIKNTETFQTIETTGTVQNITDIENIVVTSNVERSLKIKDIATVTIDTVEDDSYVNIYSKNKETKHAVLITIAKKKGENISNITQAIEDKIKVLQSKTLLLNNINLDILRNDGRVANEEITRLTGTLIQAICIVFLVLFAFLNARAAIMVAITIPLTLLTVFGIGHLAGYTINRITLFALILSLGLLVDNATVVVENIVRNRRENPDWDKVKLITLSVSEVGTGLFLSTLTTVLAFLPMKFVTGMMGPYMGPLPFFVSTAIIVSLVYSYTIVPWMASVFCKNTGPQESKQNRFTKIFARFMRAYTNVITNILSSAKKRKRVIFVCVILVCLVMTFPALKLLRFRMLPKADREQMYVYLELNLGTSIEQTYQVSKKLAAHLTQENNIKSVQTFVGTKPILDFNGLFKGASHRKGTHQASLKLNLTHPDSRESTSEDLALVYRANIATFLKKHPGSAFQLVEDPPGPPVRATFFVKIKGSNRELIEKTALDLKDKAQHISELKDLDTSVPEAMTKYTLRVNTEKAAFSKVSTASIAKTLEVLYQGSIVGIYHDDSNREQEYIVLRFDKKHRENISGLNNIMIINDVGNPIPVNRFLEITKTPTNNIILADNREPVVYLSGEMGARSVTYAAIDFLKLLYNYTPPVSDLKRTSLSLMEARYEAANNNWLKIEIDGEWKMTLEVFRDLGLAMGIAILLIYLVLVAQFRSYLIPLLISATIPLALVGVFPGFAFLFLTDRVYFSATSMIGVIALSGIVVNNAIILLEYIMISLDKGTNLKEAVISACSVRLRPIVLTSLTTILGSLTIASDPVWSGLAWSIVFGLSLSAVLTLIVFPTLIYHAYEKKGSLNFDSCRHNQ